MMSLVGHSLVFVLKHFNWRRPSVTHLVQGLPSNSNRVLGGMVHGTMVLSGSVNWVAYGAMLSDGRRPEQLLAAGTNAVR